MPDWGIWLIVAAVCGVGEIIIFTGFVLGPLAIAASVTAAAAALGAAQETQVAAFAVLTVLSLLFLRPLARRHLTQPPESRTGAAALVGTTGLVEKPITELQPGLVRLGGEVWTARQAEPAAGDIAVGTRVVVQQITGATALVVPLTETATELGEGV